MQIGVLGPLQVETGSTRVVVPSAAQRRLLSMLVLHAGSVVPGATIEDSLGLTHGALRTAVGRLRRSLGGDAIATDPPGYRLRDASVDAGQFEELVSLARTAEDARALSLLTAAVGLWRGAAYVEFRHEPWAMAESIRLDDVRASATEELAELLITVGRAASALDLLERLVTAHPYRDRSRALELRALVALGRSTEALRHFQAYRRLLADEVGTGPSAHLVDLDRAIAAGSNRSDGSFPPLPLNPSWARERQGPVRVDPPAGALPTVVSSFVGRSVDVRTVRRLTEQHRLVTLTGVGGCGKTRLALHAVEGVAERHPGGIRWVELAPVTGADEVAERVALALGERVVVGADPTVQVVRALAGRGPTLLVLDNAEHVIDPVAAFVAAVLGASADARVLVTSREALSIPGELVWRVLPLSVPGPDPPRTLSELTGSSAVELLVQRCRSARPSLALDDAAAPHLAAICARLDGIPLALELAAASIRAMPLADLAAQLKGAVDLIGPSRSLPERHRSLEACVAWSLDVLGPQERAVLSHLSTFRGAFTLDAASAVAADADADTARVPAIIGRLVDTSLLQLDDETGRYRMFETIRAVCARRTPPDDLFRARTSHARQVADWCTDVGDGRHGVERDVVLSEMPDVVAALGWARTHAPREALRICAGLAPVRSALGYHRDLADTWEWLLGFDREGPLAAEWAVAVAGLWSTATGLGLRLPPDLGEAVARRLPAGDRRAVRGLARGQAMVPAYRGDLGPISACAEGIVAARDDVEISKEVARLAGQGQAWVRD